MAAPALPSTIYFHSDISLYPVRNNYFLCQMRTPLDSAVPVRGSFRMLRVEPEPELLIVALRSNHEREEDSRHGADQGSPSNFLEHLLNAAPEAIMITRGSANDRKPPHLPLPLVTAR